MPLTRLPDFRLPILFAIGATASLVLLISFIGARRNKQATQREDIEKTVDTYGANLHMQTPAA